MCARSAEILVGLSIDRFVICDCSEWVERCELRVVSNHGRHGRFYLRFFDFDLRLIVGAKPMWRRRLVVAHCTATCPSSRDDGAQRFLKIASKIQISKTFADSAKSLRSLR